MVQWCNISPWSFFTSAQSNDGQTLKDINCDKSNCMFDPCNKSRSAGAAWPVCSFIQQRRQPQSSLTIMLPRPVNPLLWVSYSFFVSFVDTSRWVIPFLWYVPWIPAFSSGRFLLVTCPFFVLYFCFASSFLWATASSASPVLDRWVFVQLFCPICQFQAFSYISFKFLLSIQSQWMCFVQFIFHKRHTCLSTLGEREKECPPDVNYCELRCCHRLLESCTLLFRT